MADNVNVVFVFPKTLTDAQKAEAAEILQCEVEHLYPHIEIEDSGGEESDDLDDAEIPHVAKSGQSDNSGPHMYVFDGEVGVGQAMDYEGKSLLVRFDLKTGQMEASDAGRVVKLRQLLQDMGMTP